MSDEPRKISPFATPEKYCTSLALCSALKQFYKVPDAEKWYIQNRKRIIDKALPDPFDVTEFKTVHEWHDYHCKKQLYFISQI